MLWEQFLFIFMREEIHPELCRWSLDNVFCFSPSVSELRRLFGWFQVWVVCLWTQLSQNRPSAHDVPSYLERPSVAHIAPALSDDPSVGSDPTVETKTPSTAAFIHKLFLPFSPQNLLVSPWNGAQPAAAHTWRPIHRTGHILPAGVGGHSKRRAHVSTKSYTTMAFPPFLSPPQSCATSHPLALMAYEVLWPEPGNICFSLVFVNSLDWKQHETHT